MMLLLIITGGDHHASMAMLLSLLTSAVFSSQIQSSKNFFRHLHGDLNLDEIKNALHSLSVNRETNLMNLIRL